MADWCEEPDKPNRAADAFLRELERVKKMRADEHAALRALATGWETEAKAWHSSALREDAGHEHAAAVQCRGRARVFEEHAKAIFAIVGSE